ncbi:MAG: RNA polymerase sigma factor [Fimbriiglobus sp.]|nr:RNA polymerase sigma factor [Fimbriiglobus sp.]
MPRTPTAAELDAWVLETAPRATAYARSLLRDADRADDVVQDCYCRLLAKASVYDLPRDGLKLLLTAVSNACINATTRRKTVFRLVRAEDDATDDPPDPTAPAPDLAASANELGAAVAEALAALPPNQRAAVELKGLGYSQQEIAEVLGVTPSNAGVLIHRGRQALAARLGAFLEPGPQ